MRLPDPFVAIADYPVAELLAALPDAASALWDGLPFRQNHMGVHRQTRSVVIRWLSHLWTPGQPPAIFRNDRIPADLTAAVEACGAALLERRPGTIAKLVLAELAPGAAIAEHVDKGAALVVPHRCHVPILSSPDVVFWIDRKPHYLEPGTAYEVDNTRPHAVDNHGATRRVHLICDILPPA